MKEKNIYKAAKVYNVPKETLRCHVILGIGTGAQKQGTKPVLSFEEEQPLVDALQYCSKCRIPQDRDDIADIVKKYCKSLKKEDTIQRWVTRQRLDDIVYKTAF